MADSAHRDHARGLLVRSSEPHHDASLTTLRRAPPEGHAGQPTATSSAAICTGWGVFSSPALIFLIVIFDDDETPASATETAEAAPTTETISSPLSFGDSGPDVVIVQERLAAEGLPVTADGVYGQETADAVIAFQEQEQLTVDGVVGSETGEALGIWSS